MLSSKEQISLVNVESSKDEADPRSPVEQHCRSTVQE